MRIVRKDSYYELETMATLLNEGYTIQDIMYICKHLFHSKSIDYIDEQVRLGFRFEECLKHCHYPKRFIQFFEFFLVKNEVHYAMQQSLSLCRKFDDFKTNLIKKLKYPIGLCIFMLFFSLFVVVFLIPQVKDLMVQFNHGGNVFQDVVFSLFSIIPILLLFSSVVFIGGIVFIVYSIQCKKSYTIYSLLKIPFIEGMIKKYYSIYFAMYYNELLLNHYEPLMMLSFFNTYLSTSVLKVVIYELNKELEQGDDLFDCLQRCIYFEDTFKSFLYLLDKENKEHKDITMYLNLSFIYIEERVERLLKMIIPMVYGFVGCFVVFIYLAIILPLMDVIAII